MTFVGMKEGVSGPLVGYLQSVLAKTGFNPGKTDCVFGRRTKDAVMRFQQKAEIFADGQIDRETFLFLLPYLRGWFEYTPEENEDLSAVAAKFSSPTALLNAANPEKTEKLTVPVFYNTVPVDVPYCHEILEFNLQNIVKRFPFASLFSIGKSVLGKELYVLKIGDGEKEIFYNGAHHANEWITSLLLARFAEQVCAAYSSGSYLAGENIRKTVENSTLYILPCVNPDGVDLVTGAFPPASAVFKDAKTMSDGDDFPKDWKANIVGVDLNLNYPAGWEEARDYKFSLGYTDPRAFGYVGRYPLSEPESRAVAAFTEKHSFSLVLALHSQGGEIFPEYRGLSPENTAEIAEEFSRISGYEAKKTPDEMGNAGYKDWFISKFSKPGFTVEVGSGKNPLPLSQFPEIYRDVVGILAAAPRLA